MTFLDVGAIVVIGLTAIGGFRRGLVIGLCSLVGLALGAYVGSKFAPTILRHQASVYPPLIALAGAMLGAGVGQMVAITIGRTLREQLRIGLLKAFDNLGGALLGGATGLVFVWVLGSVLLYLPDNPGLRRDVQRSAIVGTLTSHLPPSDVIGALARIDTFESLAGPDANVPPGDPAVLRDPQVRAAARSVVRVIGNACGLGIEGSGWIAEPGLVVTNAHVVAGVRHPYVDRQDERLRRGEVVAFDAENDLAVVRVPGLRGRPLVTAPPSPGVAVAILGYPENGPFEARTGRLGNTAPTFVHDAYGRFPVARAVTSIRGEVEPGNSGGPAVDGQGRVRTIVFARRAGAQGGFGVPIQLVANVLRTARQGDALASRCASP